MQHSLLSQMFFSILPSSILVKESRPHPKELDGLRLVIDTEQHGVR